MGKWIKASDVEEVSSQTVYIVTKDGKKYKVVHKFDHQLEDWVATRLDGKPVNNDDLEYDLIDMASEYRGE
jgi:hypothetical protein